MVKPSSACCMGRRPAIWADTIRIAKNFWLTGTGLNTYGVSTLYYQTAVPGQHLRDQHLRSRVRTAQRRRDRGLPRRRSWPQLPDAWRPRRAPRPRGMLTEIGVFGGNHCLLARSRLMVSGRPQEVIEWNALTAKADWPRAQPHSASTGVAITSTGTPYQRGCVPNAANHCSKLMKSK